jgi:hypothetical protein
MAPVLKQSECRKTRGASSENPSHCGCLQAGKNLVDPLTATICSVFPIARCVAGNGT